MSSARTSSGASCLSPIHETRSSIPSCSDALAQRPDVRLVVKARCAGDELRRSDQQQVRVDAPFAQDPERLHRDGLALPRAQLREHPEQHGAFSCPPQSRPRALTVDQPRIPDVEVDRVVDDAQPCRGATRATASAVYCELARMTLERAAISRSVAVEAIPGGRQSRTCVTATTPRGRPRERTMPARIELAWITWEPVGAGSAAQLCCRDAHLRRAPPACEVGAASGCRRCP